MTISKFHAGTAAAALALLVSAGAQAQTTQAVGPDYPDRGFYWFGNIGLHDPMDSNIEGSGISTEAELEKGFAGLTGLGYDFGDNWRLEIEGGYRESDVEEIGGGAATGDTDAISAIANVFYDFNSGGGIEPYIGGGLGMTQVAVNGTSPIGGSSIDDEDWGIALQAGAGIAVPSAAA